MSRSGHSLLSALLALVLPLLASAGDNSLLVPADTGCLLEQAGSELPLALQACRQRADRGDAEAQLELGEYFHAGEPPRDLPQALHWFEQASLLGNARAQWHLGSMFFRGEGVLANRVQAYIVLKMAAINGSDEAMDSADQVAEQMPREELYAASQVLGEIFRDYLQQQHAGSLPDSPSDLPGAAPALPGPGVPAFAPH